MTLYVASRCDPCSKAFCTLLKTAMSSLQIEGQGLSKTITLNDGHKIPLFGMGLYKSEQEKASETTVKCLQHGYRLLDTAVMYNNENDVGEGIQKSGVKREDIFVVTKISPGDQHHGYNEAIQGVKDSVQRLGTGYIDLMLIHSPKVGKNLETYDGLLKMKAEGLVRSVGVSNFGVRHLEEMRKAGKPTPAVNQLELNCFWRKEDVVKYCQDHGIAPMGFSPVFRCRKMDHPVLVKMTKNYNKTVPQIMIRWSLQKNYITIPKTSTPARIVENADIFDFQISEEDIKLLDSLPPERCVFDTDPTESPWLG